MFWNKPLGTATSAGWKVTYRPCRTTFAPIFTSFSRNVVSDQCSTSSGKASVGSDLGTVKLKLQATVKIQYQTAIFRFTHRGSHINTPNPPIT